MKKNDKIKRDKIIKNTNKLLNTMTSVNHQLSSIQKIVTIIVGVILFLAIIVLPIAFSGIQSIHKASTNTPGPIVVINDVEREIAKISFTKTDEDSVKKVDIDLKGNYYSETGKLKNGSKSSSKFSFEDTYEKELADSLVASGIFDYDDNSHSSGLSWSIKITYADGKTQVVEGRGYNDTFEKFDLALTIFRSKNSPY